jgi:hypothetical protein
LPYLEETLRCVLNEDAGADQMQIEVIDDALPEGAPTEFVRKIAGERYTRSAGLPQLNDQPKLYLTEAVRSKIDRFKLPDQFIVVHCGSMRKAVACKRLEADTTAYQ